MCKKGLQFHALMLNKFIIRKNVQSVEQSFMLVVQTYEYSPDYHLHWTSTNFVKYSPVLNALLSVWKSIRQLNSSLINELLAGSFSKRPVLKQKAIEMIIDEECVLVYAWRWKREKMKRKREREREREKLRPTSTQCSLFA